MSTLSRQKGRYQLDPSYIVGFVDGEGCFSVTCGKHIDCKAGYTIQAAFEMEVVTDDYPIMQRIYKTLGRPGQLYTFSFKRYPAWKPHCKIKVSNLKDLTEKIIPFFTRYPLQSKKRRSFQIFCRIVRMIQQKKHLQPKYAKQILRLRETMNPTGKGQRKYQRGNRLGSRSAGKPLATP
jgi:hypothetical protein